jgi:hypothetical protein
LCSTKNLSVTTSGRNCRGHHHQRELHRAVTNVGHGSISIANLVQRPCSLTTINRFEQLIPQRASYPLVPAHTNATSTGIDEARTCHCRAGSKPSRTAQRSARRPDPQRPAARSSAAAAGAPPWCGAPDPSCSRVRTSPPTPARGPRIPDLPATRQTTAPAQTLGPGHIEKGRQRDLAEEEDGGGDVVRVWKRAGGWGFLSRFRLLLPFPSSPRVVDLLASGELGFGFEKGRRIGNCRRLRKEEGATRKGGWRKKNVKRLTKKSGNVNLDKLWEPETSNPKPCAKKFRKPH